jgi:hypothetical protein
LFEARVRDSIPDSLWSALLERHGHHLVDSGDESFNAFATEALADLKEWAPTAARYAPRGRIRHGREPSPDLSERDNVLSTLVARKAGNDQDVVAFRREVLRDALLHLHQVWRWLMARRPRGDESIADDPLAYALEDSLEREIDIGTTGDLARLRELSVRLGDFYEWTDGQATTFVLTGLAPMVSPVRVEWYEHVIGGLSRVTLTVDPTTPPREVATAYGRARRELLGPRHRSVGEKHLQLALFAETYSSGPWAERCRAWDAEHPQWAYADRVKTFARDCRVAVQRVLFPTGRPADDERA